MRRGKHPLIDPAWRTSGNAMSLLCPNDLDAPSRRTGDSSVQKATEHETTGVPGTVHASVDKRASLERSRTTFAHLLVTSVVA